MYVFIVFHHYVTRQFFYVQALMRRPVLTNTMGLMSIPFTFFFSAMVNISGKFPM